MRFRLLPYQSSILGNGGLGGRVGDVDLHAEGREQTADEIGDVRIVVDDDDGVEPELVPPRDHHLPVDEPLVDPVEQDRHGSGRDGRLSDRVPSARNDAAHELVDQ